MSNTNNAAQDFLAGLMPEQGQPRRYAYSPSTFGALVAGVIASYTPEQREQFKAGLLLNLPR